MEEELRSRGGQARLDAPQGVIHCMTIIGQIEGHVALPAQSKATSYEHVLPELAAAEESPEIRGLLLILNTIGGDVEAGLAIAEMIAGMRTPTASLVLGGGHSIGVPLAVAAKRSFIVPSASMTLHPVRFSGVLVGAPQSFDYLTRIQDRIVRFIVGHSRADETQLRACIGRTGELAGDIGTSLSGTEAVEMGLVDELGGIAQALDFLHAQIAKGE